MNIIQHVNETIKNQEVITSRIPANRGHFLIPVLANTKWYYRDFFITVLLKHAFVSGAILDSENTKLAYDKVPSGTLANTRLSDPQIRKPESCVNYSTKDALQILGSQSGAKFLWIIHNKMAPPDPPAKNSRKRNARPQYYVGFDTEYWQDEKARHVLSYQFSTVFDGDMYTWICFAENRKFPFSVLLSWFLEDMNKQGFGFSFTEPSCIWIVSHYGSVDYTATHKYDYILESSDSLRKTLVTIEKPVFLRLADSSRNGCTHRIFLRDTTLLSPAGSSLDELGKVLGIGKVEIPPEYDKSDMKTFLTKEPLEFMVYACIDPVVTLHWAFSVMAFTGSDSLPVTIASHGANWVKKQIMKSKRWKKKDFNSHYLGRKVVVDEKGKGRARVLEKWSDDLVIPMSAASESFYGGRNECFLYGIHHGPWYDYDLSGAYSIAMQMLGTPLLSECHEKTDLDEITLKEYACARIEFEFPIDTPFPCFPIKDDEGRGLIFPLKGRTWATSPEIVLARKLGAKIRLVEKSYYSVPMGDRVFGEAVKVMIGKREEAKKQYGPKSIYDLLWKEMINSVYGKLGQGLSGKRAFSTRRKATHETPFSPITMPFMASYVTSFIRACVTAAMTEIARAGYRIASVTTDGFLSDAPPEVVFGLNAFDFGDIYRNLRREVAGKDDMFEIKHKARDIVIFTTRGCFGVGEIEEGGKTWELPQAKAGYYFKGLEGEFGSKTEKKNRESEYLAELFLSRKGRITYEKTILPCLRDYLLKKKELARIETKAIKWEFDFKRMPDLESARTERITINGRDHEHLSFGTLPWNDMGEFKEVRSYRDDHDQMYIPMKEKRQLARLIFYARSRKAIREAGYKVRDTKIDDENEILRPYVMSLLGAYLKGEIQRPKEWKGRNYTQIAMAVNETIKNTLGYELQLSKDDLKKAKARFKGIIESPFTEYLRNLFEGGYGNVKDGIGEIIETQTERVSQPA